MDPNLCRLSNETKPPPLSIPAGMVRFSRCIHFHSGVGRHGSHQCDGHDGDRISHRIASHEQCMGIIILMFIVLWLMEKCTKNKALHNRKKAVNHIKTKTYSKVYTSVQCWSSVERILKNTSLSVQFVKRISFLQTESRFFPAIIFSMVSCPCLRPALADCIEKWLIDEKPICPNCRCPVVKEDPSLNVCPPYCTAHPQTPQQLTPEELRRQRMDSISHSFSREKRVHSRSRHLLHHPRLLHYLFVLICSCLFFLILLKKNIVSFNKTQHNRAV